MAATRAVLRECFPGVIADIIDSFFKFIPTRIKYSARHCHFEELIDAADSFAQMSLKTDHNSHLNTGSINIILLISGAVKDRNIAALMCIVNRPWFRTISWVMNMESHLIRYMYRTGDPALIDSISHIPIQSRSALIGALRGRHATIAKDIISWNEDLETLHDIQYEMGRAGITDLIEPADTMKIFRGACRGGHLDIMRKIIDEHKTCIVLGYPDSDEFYVSAARSGDMRVLDLACEYINNGRASDIPDLSYYVMASKFDDPDVLKRVKKINWDRLSYIASGYRAYKIIDCILDHCSTHLLLDHVLRTAHLDGNFALAERIAKRNLALGLTSSI